jgi:nucleotide-binding universal stress UspA family protein
MTATNVISHESRVTEVPGSELAVRNILVPVDFSPASDYAWNYAARFAKKFGARLTLLHVAAPDPVLSVAGISVTGSKEAFDRRAVEKSLRTFAAHAASGNADMIDYVAVPGIPSHEIVEYAQDHGSDLIIMSSHGYTGWTYFCLGSTAERVLRAAPCPVLLVREKEHELI